MQSWIQSLNKASLLLFHYFRSAIPERILWVSALHRSGTQHGRPAVVVVAVSANITKLLVITITGS
jgi:hypothetical protein